MSYKRVSNTKTGKKKSSKIETLKKPTRIYFDEQEIMDKTNEFMDYMKRRWFIAGTLKIKENTKDEIVLVPRDPYYKTLISSLNWEIKQALGIHRIQHYALVRDENEIIIKKYKFR